MVKISVPTEFRGLKGSLIIENADVERFLIGENVVFNVTGKITSAYKRSYGEKSVQIDFDVMEAK